MVCVLKNISFLNRHPQPVLVALLAGSAAYRAENESPAASVAVAMAKLRAIFGADIPDPEMTHVTGWYSDEFSRGTYSYIPPGATGVDFDRLAQPVGERVFFAGEVRTRLPL
jgi:monoamine oxidase